MKWFLLLIIFIVGVFYLLIKKTPDLNRWNQEGPNASQAAAPAPPPPAPPQPAPPPPPLEQRMNPQALSQMRSLTKDPDSSVRFTAIQTLLRMKDPTIYQVIDHAVKYDVSPALQTQLVGLLAGQKDPAVLPLLANYAAKSINRDVRLASIQALGESGNEAALSVLTKLMRDYDADIKSRSITAVERLQNDLDNKRREEEQKRRQAEEERRRQEEQAQRLQQQQQQQGGR